MQQVNHRIFLIVGIIAIGCLIGFAQTPAGDTKHFAKDGVSFDYPNGWVMQDETNLDAQTLKFARADSDAQITVFVHRGRITAEKMPDAKKAFIDPYVEGTAKQFASYGARVERSPASTEIAGIVAEGINLKAIVTGDSATSQIYWALVNGRVAVLTFFGPDNDRKKFASSWDLVRNSLKVEEAKPVAKPSPKATPKP